jgi:hypothetical protein
MPNPKASVILPVISLLAVTAGGIFISAQWRTAVYYQEEINKETLAVAEDPKAPIPIKIIDEPVPEKGANAKGVYLNEFIANSNHSRAVAVRDEIESLLDETELNAVVIDIKEIGGPYMPLSLKSYIEKLREKGVWVIARICVFRDSSLLDSHPEWYLKREKEDGSIEVWKDGGGGHWLDPKGSGVQNYIIDFSKKAIDFGFDELQFDYIRFPSDGDVESAVYPFYDKSREERYRVIGDFFSELSLSLRNHNPEIILSVDLFGYVAAHRNSMEIGQRTYDAAQHFDYISYMLYPSHFYGGLQVSRDLKRGLPSMYLPYQSDDLSKVVSNNPYSVIARSIFIAVDYLDSIGSKAKIRPWLQDFNISRDTERGIYYDSLKVREQILAAEESGADGWLLWNSSGRYTKEALLAQ